jgi:protein TonB
MRQRMQGRAVLLVEVSADGRPLQITIFRSSGHEILDNAAIETVKGWRFVPAMKDGAPIVATLRVPINYQLGIFAR